MLKIRREQLAVFDAAQLRRLEAEAAAHLRERFPSRNPGELSTLAADVVHRAAHHEIVSSPAVLRYAVLAAGRGLRFDEEPWAALVLRETWRSEADRMLILEALAEACDDERF